MNANYIQNQLKSVKQFLKAINLNEMFTNSSRELYGQACV
jgi:hypothetical protein